MPPFLFVENSGISNDDFRYFTPNNHKESDLNATSPPIAIEYTRTTKWVFYASINRNSKTSVHRDSNKISHTSYTMKPLNDCA